MSRLWSMFRFRSFRIFCEKIAIFRTFDHWSEILSMSAGRPLGQGVCPPLVGGGPNSTRGQNTVPDPKNIKSSPRYTVILYVYMYFVIPTLYTLQMHALHNSRLFCNTTRLSLCCRLLIMIHCTPVTWKLLMAFL
jgi:hypothetical protein